MAQRAGRTKIVCTLGPASGSVEIICRLIDAGMDVARLNFSHGTHEEHRTVLTNVREAARKTGEYLTVLQDLQGPKIRIGELSVPAIDLQPGSRLVITTAQVVGGPGRISTTYPG